MKKRNVCFRACLTVSVILLSLLLALGMASCTLTGPDTDTETESTTSDTASDVETDPATEAETEPAVESDTDEATTLPAVDTGIHLDPQSSVVILSAYATYWEQDAADRLVTLLNASGIIADTDDAGHSYRVVIGDTKLNNELGIDPDAVGNLGYVIAVDDFFGTIAIAANTKDGMDAAMAAFEAALTEAEDGCVFVPTKASATVVLEAETETAPAYTGIWDENIDYAQSLQNGIQTQFTDYGRNNWVLYNQNVRLDYDLADKNCYTSIANSNGVPYVVNTGYVYLLDADGKMWSNEKSRNNASYNIYEMGFYYNNTHIRGHQFGTNRDLASIRLDTTLHMYSDKLNVVQHLVADIGSASTSGLAGYGQYYEIAADRVLQLVVKDKNGTHDSLEGVDWDSVEYVGFDIDRAGVFGIILLKHENSGRLTVTLENGVYTVDQRNSHDPNRVITNAFHLYFGIRMYTDDSHDFTAFLAEAEAERNPLSFNNLQGCFREYDALRGAYKGQMPTVAWGNTSKPNDYSQAKLTMIGDDMDRKFYFYTDCGFGALECAVMLDGDNNVLPIALEVTKNFGGENEEPLYDPGDHHYGNTYVPVTLKAGETRTFSFLGLNMNWGKTPLKQLSSIQFFSPYYHLSLGPWESNCISPDGVQGKNYWTLPDFRPVGSGSLGGDGQYTAHSVIKILQYTDSNGVAGGLENYHDHIDSYGPVYADITMDYTSTDGRLDVSYRHVELPNEDENRTLYSVRIKVKEEISFTEFRKDVALFYFDGRGLQYGTLTYLNENNEVTYETVLTEEVNSGYGTVSGEKITLDRTFILGNGTAPYFGYYNAVNGATHLPNFGFVMKDWDIVIGGETFEGNFILRDYFQNNTTSAELSLDLGEVTLQPGDYINLDFILMPWGKKNSADDTSIQNVRNDTVVDPFTITAKKGTVIEDTYVPKVYVDETGTAEFTVTGGASNGVVRVYGLKDYTGFQIKEKLGSLWMDYDNSSERGYDGYMVYAEEDGTYSIAFAFNMDDAGEEGRTFRVRIPE